jgi:hypothetical protein
MKRTFTWGRHDNGDGLIPDFMPGGWPCLEGGLIAHDCLEHPLGNGGCENELMALGAVWFGRGEMGYLGGTMRSPEETVGFDVAQCLEQVFYGAQTLTHPGRTTALEDADSYLTDITLRGMEVFRQERKYDQNQDEGALPHDASARVLGWMRRGYRWARRTYKDSHNLTRLFDDIAGRVGKEIYAEEGEVLVVRWSVRDLEASVHRFSVWD